MKKKQTGPPLTKLTFHKNTGASARRKLIVAPPGMVLFGELKLGDYLRMTPTGELLTKSLSGGKGVAHGPTTRATPGAMTAVWPAERDGHTNSVARDIARWAKLTGAGP